MSAIYDSDETVIEKIYKKKENRLHTIKLLKGFGEWIKFRYKLYHYS